MAISVVVPVYNEARFIERTLTQLVSQRYDPQCFEVIVVDGHSTDGTAALIDKFAQRHDNVRLLTNPRRLSSSARNIGIQKARGDVVVIVDGHCRLEDDQYLGKVAAALAESGADCLGRPQPLDMEGASPLQRAVAAARSCWLGHHPDSFIYSSQEQFVPAKSVAVAYHRSVFDKVGYFDEGFDACEDVELNHRVDRAGLRCFFTPQVAVHYSPRASLAGLFWQMVRYGRGRIRLSRKHPETFSVRCCLPALLLIGCLVGSLLAWVSSLAALAFVTALAFYAITLVVTSAIIVGQRRDPRILLWLPLVFLTIHAGSGMGECIEALHSIPRILTKRAPQVQP